MKTSLKLLLLGTALIAVTLAWVRVRHDYAEANSQILRNANWNAETISVPEAQAPPSRLTIDASGAISRARLMGPAGFDAIRNHPQGQEHIAGLTFGSLDSVSHFDPTEFPDLSWVAFDDSFDLEYTTLSLDWLRSLGKLKEINFEARSTDPRPALSTLPNHRSWTLKVWTDQVPSFDAFPKLGGLSNFELHVPDSSDVDAISMSLKNQLPDCHVVVWDNFGPQSNPF